MEYILSIALFAISTSVTPGPNNIMVMTSALNFGIRKSLPLLAGICVGFTVMLLLVGLGAGQLFSLFPHLALIVKIVGSSYLVYLAWLIARANSTNSDSDNNKPIGFLKGALFQWVNGKAWVVVIGAISAYTNAGDSYATQNIIIAISFLFISIPCVGVWLLFGSYLQQHLKQAKYRRLFNLSMAFLLILSILPVFLDIWLSINA